MATLMEKKWIEALTLIKNKLLAESRNLVQLVIFIITIAAGFQFYIYISQVLGDNPITFCKYDILCTNHRALEKSTIRK